jgi:hypothetical protein
VIHSIQLQTCKSSTIISTFRQVGLIPYNPALVISKLPPLPPPPQDPEPIEINELDLNVTPEKIPGIARFAQAIQEQVMACSGGLQLAVHKFVKGALARVQSGAQAKEDLE